MEEESIISPSTHGSNSGVREQVVAEDNSSDNPSPFRRHTSFEGSVATGIKFRQQANLGDFLQEALDVDELIIEDEDQDEGFSDSVHDLYLAAFQKLTVDEAAFRRHSVCYEGELTPDEAVFRRHSVGYEGELRRTDDVETQNFKARNLQKEEEEITRMESQNLDDLPDEASSANTTAPPEPEDLSAANTAAALRRSMTRARAMTKPTMFKPLKNLEQFHYESSNSESSIGTEVSGDGIVKDEITKTNTSSKTNISSWNYRSRVLFYMFLVMVGIVSATISFFLIKFVEPKIETI